MAIQRLLAPRALHAQPLLPLFLTSSACALSPRAHVSSTVQYVAQFELAASNRGLDVFPPSCGEPGEERLASPLLPADRCHTAGIEEMGLHRNRQSVVETNKRPPSR